MSIKRAIGYSVLFTVLGGLTVDFLHDSEQLSAANEWGRFAAAIFLALGCFAVLVVCVKAICGRGNKEENGDTEEE